MKKKSELHETFKKWKDEVENQTGKKIQSDNGGEYGLAKHTKLREENDIILKRTIPGKPR